MSIRSALEFTGKQVTGIKMKYPPPKKPVVWPKRRHNLPFTGGIYKYRNYPGKSLTERKYMIVLLLNILMIPIKLIVFLVVAISFGLVGLAGYNPDPLIRFADKVLVWRFH